MIQDWLSRTQALYGPQPLNKLLKAHVALAGLGGVGGYTLEALARSGISNFTLIDFDTFDITNLNRQILSLYDNIGKPKTEEAVKRIKNINPNASCKIITAKLSEDNIEDFLLNADIAIDAIDDINAKAILICKCLEKQIPIVSSMGAAKRTDPTKVMTADISKTFGCPLAKSLRNKLKEQGASGSVECVFSPEHFENYSKEVLGSSVTVVGTFGFTLAQLAINKLIN